MAAMWKEDGKMLMNDCVVPLIFGAGVDVWLD